MGCLLLMDEHHPLERKAVDPGPEAGVGRGERGGRRDSRGASSGLRFPPPARVGGAAVWSAEQGFAPAQFDLAMDYYNGEGVPKDKGAAAEWLEKAANLGYANATYLLGVMYLEGTINRSPMQNQIAMDKFQMAAEQGYLLAALNLGEIYSGLFASHRFDVQRDDKKACVWLLIADDLNKRAGWETLQPGDIAKLRKVLPGKISEIQKKLTGEPFADCQREVGEWVKAHPFQPAFLVFQKRVYAANPW